ncbi:MAG: hypothetical protein MUC96_05770 [Myxococcaceae bacterium]|jgi:hypothetical protein|nr:hypothetical protein [Myxococcaceae bacterium]
MRTLLPLLLVLVACAPKVTGVEQGPTEPDAFPVDDASEGAGIEVRLGVCPTAREPVDGKLAHAAYVDTHPGETHFVNVMLRSNGLPDMPACEGDERRDARCTARDQALRQRMLANAQQVSCVLDGLTRVSVVATWYEEPFFTSEGPPGPVGLGFSIALSATQVRQLAAHPFVSRVEPAFGEARRIGVTAPNPPAGCPTQAENGASKVADARSIEGRGRRPVLIDLKHGALPEHPIAQAVVNTRDVTCVRRAIDQVAQASSPSVPFGQGFGNPGTAIPPFGASLAVVKTFGAGLTWDEVQRVAQHPLVERIWTFDGLEFDQPQPGCPPDLTKPIQSVTCPAARESIDGKLTNDDRTRFSQAEATTKHGVVVLVRGGATICQLPTCPPPPGVCAEMDALTSRWRAENAEAQRCVRDLISSSGGTADPDVLFLVNAVSASLTWSQIQTVAAHPHVLQVQGGGSGPPSR